VAPLADRVQLIQYRLCAPGRPLGTYLFTGPSGVGKTHAALTLAELLHGDRNTLVRFDMSEYSHPTDSVPDSSGRGCATSTPVSDWWMRRWRALPRHPARRNRKGARERIRHSAAGAR